LLSAFHALISMPVFVFCFFGGLGGLGGASAIQSGTAVAAGISVNLTWVWCAYNCVVGFLYANGKGKGK